MKARAALAAGLAAATLAGCHKGIRPADSQTRAPVAVSTVAVSRQQVSRSMLLTGAVIAENQISVVPKTTGRILQLAVDEGYRVKAGQVVAVLDTPTLGLQVQQEQDALASAKANLSQARDNLSRMTDLANQGVISDQQLLGAQTQLKVAQSGYRQAQAAVALSRTNLDDRVVTSPVSGVVIQRVQDVGAMAAPGSPIVSIADGPYEARLTFAEQDLPAINEGLHLELTADALPGERFEGTVDQIAQMVDPSTHLLSCKVDLSHPGRLRIGMNVRASVSVAPHQALVVPTDALLNDGGQTVVYLDRGGVAREATVTVGDRNSKIAEILTGLQLGDRVIEQGNAFVHDGDPVAERNDASETRLRNEVPAQSGSSPEMSSNASS